MNKKVVPFPHQSKIDPTRQTVGAIYKNLQEGAREIVEAGDLAHDLTLSLVDDVNDAIASKPFGEEEFYITVYEKKDLQMKSSILRRLYLTKYRPYPEDDTVVFYVEPKTNNVKFCWCLPHWSEMDNILMNPFLYTDEYVADIKAWKKHNLKHFGFEEVKQVRKIKDKFYRLPVPIASKHNRDRFLNRPEITGKLS